MQKLEYQVGDQWQEHSFAPVFSRLSTVGGPERLEIGIPGHAEVFDKLVTCLEEPYYLLYVLHTPRGEANAGRYQSPTISQDEVRAFLSGFESFLLGDARFDLWVHSSADSATLVWDRHNLIDAYGPLDRLAAQLTSLGFEEGSVQIPTPHAHRYREELDDVAQAILSKFDWSFSPLHAEDEQ